MSHRIPILFAMTMLLCGLALNGCVKETEAESECDDGKDNDLDGLYDCDDPDCAGLGGCPGDPGDDDAADDDTADDDTGDDDTGDDDSAAGDDDSATG